jgi:hypothetical protein
MNRSFKKRHQKFVDELRMSVIRDETCKKNKFKVVPLEITSESDESRLQAELEAKFDELFGSSDEE